MKDSGEDSDSVDPPSSKNVSFPTPLNLVTPEQALEILLLLSQNSNVADHIKFDRGSLVAGNDDLFKSTSQSGPELEKRESTETVDSSSSEPVLAAEIQIIQSVETRTDPVRLLTTEKSNDVGQTKQLETEDTKIEQTAENSTSVETQSAKTEEEGIKNIASTESVTGDEASLEKLTKESARTATDELCQNKFEELKQLLSDAHKAVNNIVHTQEKLRRSDASIAETSSQKETSSQNIDAFDGEIIRKSDVTDGTVEISPEGTKETRNDTVNTAVGYESGSCMDVWTTPNVSRSNSDSHGRAGKYNKKPAPKVPLTKSEEDLNETDAQSALKATLVIKTGTLKTFSNTSVTKDVFIAHASDAKSKAKKSKRQRTKEGFSKLLTIPKNIFHGAFSKEPKRGEDSCSDLSADRSESRSNSIESQEAIVELAPKLSSSNQEINTQSDDKSENDSSNSSGSYVLALGDDKQKLETKKDTEATSVESQIREMSQSPKIVKRLESDIF